MFHIKSLELVHWDYWQRIKNIPLDAKIITIAENGHCATLNELRPHRETLADVSAARLIAAIRSAIAPREFKPTLQ